MDFLIIALTVFLLMSPVLLLAYVLTEIVIKFQNRKGVEKMPMGESLENMDDKYIFRIAPHEVLSIEGERTNVIPAGVQLIEAPSMWESANYGDGVVVAVLDTGVDIDHPNLKPNLLPGKNFTDEGAPDNPDDGNGHGTHVAGTIAGAYLESGVVGVAPKSKILPIKVLTSQGFGTIHWIIEGIKYATNWRGPNGERVRVLNLSLGGPADIPELKQAIEEAVNNEIAVVVASGNEGDEDEETYEYSYPGNYNKSIQVSASNLQKELAGFANNNDEIDVIAPGEEIISTFPGGKYAKLSGTSMATPHVAGAMALILSYGQKKYQRDLTEAEMYAMLIKRTVSIGYLPTSEGHGFVQLGYMEKMRKLLDYIENNF